MSFFERTSRACLNQERSRPNIKGPRYDSGAIHRPGAKTGHRRENNALPINAPAIAMRDCVHEVSVSGRANVYLHFTRINGDFFCVTIPTGDANAPYGCSN